MKYKFSSQHSQIWCNLFWNKKRWGPLISAAQLVEIVPPLPRPSSIWASFEQLAHPPHLSHPSLWLWLTFHQCTAREFLLLLNFCPTQATIWHVHKDLIFHCFIFLHFLNRPFCSLQWHISILACTCFSPFTALYRLWSTVRGTPPSPPLSMQLLLHCMHPPPACLAHNFSSRRGGGAACAPTESTPSQFPISLTMCVTRWGTQCFSAASTSCNFSRRRE